MLEIILKICGEDGSYKIIEISDLQKGMLPKYRVDSELLAQMIKFLAAADLIDIKYSDENVYCIAILPKGRIYEEQNQEKKHNKVITRGMAFFIIFGSFLAAIIGAAVAGVVLAWLG